MMRALGLVTDDRHGIAAQPACRDETRHAIEQARRIYPPPIDEPLQAFPEETVRPLGQQGALHGGLVALEGSRQQALFPGNPLEGVIVADQGIVEIDADFHGAAADRGKLEKSASRMSRARLAGRPSERPIFAQDSAT